MDRHHSLQDTYHILSGGTIRRTKRPGEQITVRRPQPIKHRSQRRIRTSQVFKALVLLIMLTAMIILATKVAAQGNTPPLTQPDIYSTALDTSFDLTPDLLANDSDSDNDPISLISFTQPVNGTLVDAGGVLTYTPNSGFVGLDTFTYTISDGTDESLGNGFIEVGNPDIDLFQITLGDTVSNGVPVAGAGNIEVGGASDVYLFHGEAGQDVIFDWITSGQLFLWQLTTPNGATLFNSYYFDNRLVLPETGTYTLLVHAFSTTVTSTYSLRVLEVTPSQAFTINIGDTVSNGIPISGAGNIEVPGAVDIYSFDAIAGQDVIFDWLTGSNALVGWKLEAPDGTVLFDRELADVQVLMPQNGTYTLTASGRGIDDTSAYSFRVLGVPNAEAFVISIGDVVSDGVPSAGAGNIEVPGVEDIYTFNAAADEGVIFDWLSGSNALVGWKLEAPDGTVLFDRELADIQVLMTQSGTYTLTVGGRGVDAVDEYSFQLLSVPSTADEFPISIGDTVSDGVPGVGAGNIEVPGATDIYTFDAIVGEAAIFDWLTGTNTFIQWRLEAPDGTVLFDRELADIQVLFPISGTYTLTVKGRGVDDTDTYSFQLLSVPSSADVFAINIGDTVSDGIPGVGAGNIEVPGALDIYTFDANAGDTVIFDWINGSNVQLAWRLEAPDRTVLFNGFLQDHQVSMPQTGTYTLILRGSLVANVGQYSFQLLATPSVEEFVINIGDTVSEGIPATGAGNIEVPGAVDIYRFDAVAGLEVVFDWLNGSNALVVWRLDAPDGTVLFDRELSDQQVLLAQTGTYTLTVKGRSVDDFDAYSFALLEFELNSDPVATDDDVATDEDVAATFDVLSNDTDVDGDTLSVESVTQPSNGTVVNNGINVTYTPNLNFNGIDTFTYIVSDGNGGTDEATVMVTVNPVNDNPVATDDDVSTDEDVAATFDVLSNDTDVDGDTLSVESVTQPANGTVVNNGIDVTYTPNLNFNGIDTFTYIVSDGNGGIDEATVTVTVNPVNDNPVAADDDVSTDEDVAATFDVLSNDTDVDGDTLNVESVTQPANGMVVNNGIDVTYTPNLNFNGIDTFNYIVSDGNGGTDEATVTVTVNPVNDDPIATDDNISTDEDVPATFDVLSNDTDVDDDTLNVESVTQPANGVVVNNGADVTYTPNLNFNGIDTFTYIVSDGNGGTDEATVMVTVNPVNDDPIATDDDVSTDEDVPATFDVLSNDTDVDGDTLNVESVTQPSNGTVVNNGIDVTYTPNLNFNGIDTFTYIVSDSNGGTDEATVTVIVNPVNDNPLATDDDVSTDEDVAATFDVLSNDTDVDGDTLSVESVTQPANGMVVNNGIDVTYTPNLNFNGIDTFTYIVSDGNGGTDEATVTVTVNPVNDNPLATDDDVSTDEDVAATFDVLSNDIDVDGDTLIVGSVTQPANGVVVNNGADVTYTPNLNFNGIDTFTYIVSDGNGGIDEATVTVTVNPVNDDPVATDDNISTDEDVPATFDVLSNDTDVDGDTLNVESVTQPSNGTVVNNGIDVTYTPNLNFNGIDTFTYIVSDSNGGTDEATVTVIVNPVNHDPVATDDDVSTDEDTPATFDVLTNDTDVDGDTLNVESVTQPANGTVVNNGIDATYTPNLNFNGIDTFTYIVSDGNGGTDEATVTVTVNPVNDAPVVNNPGDQMNNEGETVALQIVAHDPEGDILTYSADGLPPALIIDTNSGLISGNLDYNASGNYFITVNVSDATVSVEVEFLWTVFDVSQTDECYATEVISYQPGEKKNGLPIDWSHNDPTEALGPPEGDYSANYVALGFGNHQTTGVLVLGFSPRIITNDNGHAPDFRVWETTAHDHYHWIAHPERVLVEASQDGEHWLLIGITTRDDQAYDLGPLQWARYIRLTDISNRHSWRFNGFADGFDVDAVEGFECATVDEEPPMVAVPGQWVESNDSLVTLDGWWATITTPLASGNNYLYTVGSSSDMSLQFIGTSVEVIYPKHPTLGAFTVFIDNTAVRTVIQWGWPSEFQRRALFTGLEPGVHTIVIVPAGGVTAIDAFHIPD